MTFRKDGCPGTEKQHDNQSQGWNIAQDPASLMSQILLVPIVVAEAASVVT